MCCPLILCREETMSGADGLNKMLRSTEEGIKGGIRKECDIGDKMLMTNSSKEIFKKKEETTASHLPFITGCHHTPMKKVTS